MIATDPYLKTFVRDFTKANNGNAYYSNLEVTAGTQMADAGIELARKMTPDKMPERLPAPAFGRAWTYGNVKPEVR